MKVDQQISDRLADLVKLGDQVLATRRSPGRHVITDDRVDQQLAAQWIASVENLLVRTFGVDSAHSSRFKQHTANYISYSDVLRAQGVLKAAADDFSGGHLMGLRQLVEAEVFDDFLEQAGHLYAAGYHPAAAVVAGCVLEDALRRACAKRSIALAPSPKLDTMNSDLARVGAYSKLVQKRITALADLRNKAAHGQWTDFTAADVDEMIKSVRRLVEEI